MHRLYIVATPIGNLEDMTFRALRVLREVDTIAAEDTRVARRLLSHFEIHGKRLLSYNEHNRNGRIPQLLELLKGQDVLPLQEFLITAETPLVIIGRHAHQTALQGGGSAAVRPPHQISIVEGLREALGETRLRVFDGVAVHHNPSAAAPELIIDPETGRPVCGLSASTTLARSRRRRAVRLPNSCSVCRLVRTRARARSSYRRS